MFEELSCTCRECERELRSESLRLVYRDDSGEPGPTSAPAGR